jgi:hypothetical protein
MSVGEELCQREFAGVDIGEDGALGGVLLVDDAGLGLQETPGFAAFYAEHDQLTAEGAVLDLTVFFPGDVHAEVGDEGAVLGVEVATIDNVLLSDAN